MTISRSDSDEMDSDVQFAYLCRDEWSLLMLYRLGESEGSMASPYPCCVCGSNFRLLL